MKRLLSFILIEFFLFTTLGSELVWARPAFALQTCLRTPSVANDGASRSDLTNALRTKGPNLAPETQETSSIFSGGEAEIRKRIEQQIFELIGRGSQIQTIYVGHDLTVYVPDSRWLGRHFLLEKLPRKVRERLQGGLLGSLYAMIAVNFMDALPSYQLADPLGDLADPFLILKDVTLKMGEDGLNISFPDVIVRERSDTFLVDELKKLVREERLDEAEKKIEEVFHLDEQIWGRGLFNFELLMLRNTRIRNGKVVLRDLGRLTKDRHVAVLFLKLLRTGLLGELHPIEKTAGRLSEFAPRPLVDFYLRRAYEVYSVANFERHWNAAGNVRDGALRQAQGDVLSERSESKDGGSRREDEKLLRGVMIRAAIPVLSIASLLVVPVLSGNLYEIAVLYGNLRKSHPWMTDAATGAATVSLSDWFGQQAAYRAKGVPVLKRQIILAALLGGFYGVTYGRIYDGLAKFTLWERVGLAYFVGIFKGFFYMLVTNQAKSRWLPQGFRPSYSFSKQSIKYLTTLTVDTPVRFLILASVQGFVQSNYWTSTTFLAGLIVAFFSSWSINRRDPFSKPIARFWERVLNPLWQFLERRGVNVRGDSARDGGDHHPVELVDVSNIFSGEQRSFSLSVTTPEARDLEKSLFHSLRSAGQLIELGPGLKRKLHHLIREEGYQGLYVAIDLQYFPPEKKDGQIFLPIRGDIFDLEFMNRLIRRVTSPTVILSDGALWLLSDPGLGPDADLNKKVVKWAIADKSYKLLTRELANLLSQYPVDLQIHRNPTGSEDDQLKRMMVASGWIAVELRDEKAIVAWIFLRPNGKVLSDVAEFLTSLKQDHQFTEDTSGQKVVPKRGAARASFAPDENKQGGASEAKDGGDRRQVPFHPELPLHSPRLLFMWLRENPGENLYAEIAERLALGRSAPMGSSFEYAERIIRRHLSPAGFPLTIRTKEEESVYYQLNPNLTPEAMDRIQVILPERIPKNSKREWGPIKAEISRIISDLLPVAEEVAHARDGGRRLERYQSSPLNDLLFPGPKRLPAIEKPVEVGTGV